MLFFICYPFFRNHDWMLPKWLYKLIVVLSVSVQSVWCTDPNMVHLQDLVPEGPPLVPEIQHQIIPTQPAVLNQLWSVLKCKLQNAVMQNQDQAKQSYIQEQDEINQPFQLFFEYPIRYQAFAEAANWVCSSVLDYISTLCLDKLSAFDNSSALAISQFSSISFRPDLLASMFNPPETSDIKFKEDTHQSSLLQSNLKFPKVFGIVSLRISLLLFPVCIQTVQLLRQKSFIDVSGKGRYLKEIGKDYKEPNTDSILPCNSCSGVKPRTSVFVSKTIGTALTWTVSFASAIIGILQCAWIDALNKCSAFASETYKTALKQRESFVISKDSDFSVKPSVFSFGKTLLGSDNFCRQHELWKFVPMPF